MDWTTEAIDRLRALWAEGHSTAEIGRRMGITKNAVVGKAHRLSLPPRPSPIRREAEGEATVAAPRLPRPVVVPRLAAPAVPAVARPTVPVAVRPFPRVIAARTCCWPIGEPGTSGFRFCTAEATSGKPYCPEHAAVAYVKARDRREDAA
jgi:GcrA cell cycle regulator